MGLQACSCCDEHGCNNCQLSAALSVVRMALPACCTAVAVLCAVCISAGLVAWRSRRSTGLRLCAPFIFLLLALITHLALNANNALQVSVCGGGDVWVCWNTGSAGMHLRAVV